MNSYIKTNKKNEKSAKGVEKNIIKKELKHPDYKNILFDGAQMFH